MPLAFSSLTHGTIAFGFFHIEIDMLLLERSFFFADRFCRAVIALTEGGGPSERLRIPGWRIEDRRRLGNLGGAIRGDDLRGFLGATYARMGFPEAPEAFKQKAEGALPRAWVAETIAEFGSEAEIELVWDRAARRVDVAGIGFDEPGFGALVAYVDRGGYPRWKDDVRPGYVRELVEHLSATPTPFL